MLEGKVKRLTSFGAFVEVFPTVEGLVHISQISHKSTSAGPMKSEGRRTSIRRSRFRARYRKSKDGRPGQVAGAGQRRRLEPPAQTLVPPTKLGAVGTVQADRAGRSNHEKTAKVTSNARTSDWQASTNLLPKPAELS